MYVLGSIKYRVNKGGLSDYFWMIKTMDPQPKPPAQPNIPAKFNFDLKYQELMYNQIKASAQFRLEGHQPLRFNALRGLTVLLWPGLRDDGQKGLEEKQEQAQTKILEIRKILYGFNGKIIYDPDMADYVLIKSPTTGSDMVNTKTGTIAQIPWKFTERRLEAEEIMDKWEKAMIIDMKNLKLVFIKDKTGIDATAA